MARDLTNTIVNNTSIDPQELKTFLSLQYGARWMKLHPNYLETIPIQVPTIQRFVPWYFS
jgi:hypothetical protein